MTDSVDQTKNEIPYTDDVTKDTGLTEPESESADMMNQAEVADPDDNGADADVSDSSEHAPDAPAHAHDDPDDDDDCCGTDDDDDDEDRKILFLSPRAWLLISGVAVAAGILLGLFSDIAALNVISKLVALVGLAAGLVIITPAAWHGLKERKVNINLLMVVAAVGALALADFNEAGVVVFLFVLGETIEGQVKKRNRASIEELLDYAPAVVHLLAADGTVSDVAVEEVQTGSLLVVRPGERLSIDSVVTEGVAHLDESPVTGESIPVTKQVGDSLFAGSLCLDGRLTCMTTSSVADSLLARMVRLVEQAQASKSPYERFINRFARIYTPAVLCLAAVVATIPPLVNLFTSLDIGGFAVWVYRALTLLVISCPCALVIATPVAVVSAITRAAHHGVLVKGGAFIELAAKLKVVAFDKTGTLTVGRPQLVGIDVLSTARLYWPDDTARHVLALAALLERDSNHPLARCIVEAAKAANAQPASVLEIQDVTELAGLGVTASLAERQTAIGSTRLISTLVDLDQRVFELIDSAESDGSTALVLVFDGDPLAVFRLRDTLRPDSKDLITTLQNEKHGLRTAILTGDNLRCAQAIANESGVTIVHAALMPEEKMEYIERLRLNYGTVAFVGDGINDALALSTADVGIAMGAAGSDIALDVADVALMADDIAALPAFIALAKRAMLTMYISVAMTLLVKALVMILAVIGLSQMWMAIAADVGMLILVLLFGIRIGLGVEKTEPKSPVG